MNVPRLLYNTLARKVKPGKVNIVYGARRVGKTHLIQKFAKESNLPFLSLNGELPEVQEVIASKNINTFKNLIADYELLIIDEAQEITEVGKSLKIMIDELPSLRILASGSSAFDLGNSMGEPLVGRAFWHKMYPVSQQEFSQIENIIETKQRLEERLIYGTYPEVYNLTSFEDKKEYLLELANSYLLKDIISFDGIRNSAKVFDLLKLIAFQVGKEVSTNELGKQLGMSKNTVDKYLDLLEKVFVIKKISGFSRNLRKEISKSSRYIFLDNGIRNAVINNFRLINDRSDIGELWENYLMIERIKKNDYARERIESHFWRTYDQQEIDLVETIADSIAGFEFKWANKKSKVPAAFDKAYPNATYEVINKVNYLGFIG